MIELFEDIVAHGGGRPDPSDETDIGRALARVLSEIDEITVATLKSITLTTLLKTMRWHRERSQNGAGAGAGDAAD